MKNSTKAIIITSVVTVVAFMLTRVIWPDPAGAIEPSSAQLPFFILMSFLEALAFGLGIAFLVVGYPKVQNALPEVKRGAFATYIAIGWVLVNWWPHDNLHRVNGEDLGGLIKIEYGFHATLIIAGLTIACYFWRILNRDRSVTV